MGKLLSDVHNNPDIRSLYSDLVGIWMHERSFRNPEAQDLLEEIRSLTGVTKVDIMNLVRRDPSGSKQYIEDSQRPEITNSRQAALKDLESELDQLGYKYSVSPGSGITGTIYFVYKGQKIHVKNNKNLRTWLNEMVVVLTIPEDPPLIDYTLLVWDTTGRRTSIHSISGVYL